MEKFNKKSIKKLVIGRESWELPAILSIADGSNSIPLHILATRTIEKAGDIPETAQTKNLRKFLLANHFIQNHLQNIISVLTSFLGLRDFPELRRNHTGLYEKIILINRLALGNIIAVSGQTVRPLANSIGGFVKLPETGYFQSKAQQTESAGEDILRLVSHFAIPKQNGGVYLALRDSKEYTFYDGDLWTSKGQIIPLNKINALTEKNMLSGPRARIAINKDKQDILGEFNLSKEPPEALAIAAELLYFIRYSNKLADIFLKDKIRDEAIRPVKSSGEAASAIGSANKLFILRLAIDDGIIKDINLLTF